jgi:hypothetical protein
MGSASTSHSSRRNEPARPLLRFRLDWSDDGRAPALPWRDDELAAVFHAVISTLSARRSLCVSVSPTSALSPRAPKERFLVDWPLGVPRSGLAGYAHGARWRSIDTAGRTPTSCYGRLRPPAMPTPGTWSRKNPANPASTAVMARRDPVPGVPRLREFQRVQGEALLTRVRRRQRE